MIIIFAIYGLNRIEIQNKYVQTSPIPSFVSKGESNIMKRNNSDKSNNKKTELNRNNTTIVVMRVGTTHENYNNPCNHPSISLKYKPPRKLRILYVSK